MVLQLRDGRRVEFVVERAEPDALVAVDGTRYLHADITRAERRVFTKGQAAVLLILTGAGLLLVLLTIAVGEAVGSWS